MTTTSTPNPTPTTAAERAGRTPKRPSLATIALSRTRLELKAFFRNRESAMFNFALPVLLLVIFGSVFGNQKLGDTGVSFSQYFVAGMIASGIVYTSFQNLAIAIPLERDDGTLKRIQGMPVPKSAYFLGKVGLVAASFVAQVTLLFAIGALFYGIQIPGTAAKWATFLGVSVLGLIACTLLGIAFSSVSKNGTGASAIVSPVVLVFQFTSGVFFTFNQLPPWMQQFAALFPLKWLTQGMRSVFLPDVASSLEVTGGFEIGRVLLVLTAWVVVGALLALRFFHWERRGDS